MAPRACNGVMHPHHHEIVNANIRLVDFWFKRWGNRLQRHATDDELRAEAYYWLCRCAIRWESPRGLAFSTYCLRSMLLGIMTWATRDADQTKDMYTKRSARHIEQLKKEGVNQYIGMKPFSTFKRQTNSNGETELTSSLITPPIPPHNIKMEREELVNRLLSAVTPREREMITLYYSLDGYGVRTMQEVADHFGISRERVRQVVTKAMHRIRSFADSIGHTSEDVFR